MAGKRSLYGNRLRGGRISTEISDFREKRAKVVVALLLSFASGLIHIVGYAGIFHFFTAHLNGARVQLGHGLISRNWKEVGAATTIIGGVLLGSISGRAMIETGSRRKVARMASITLGGEAVLLAVVAGGRLTSTARQQIE
jgi:uncharacterized membrane protein YoaK (UPF0700 family)